MVDILPCFPHISRFDYDFNYCQTVNLIYLTDFEDDRCDFFGMSWNLSLTLIVQNTIIRALTLPVEITICCY